MNRSLTNVLFGGIAGPAQSQKKIEGEVTQTSIDETVEALSGAENVIIVRCSILMKEMHLTLSRSWAMEWQSPKRNTP